MTDLRERLREIRTFPSLVKFLREELDWPIDSTADFEDLTFEYSPGELGIDPANAAKIDEIKRLRPLVSNQPWGIFFVKFEPKRLPVVALRRILNRVVVKKRATPSAAEQKHWAADDLLFISAYGQEAERRISFAHFSREPSTDLPTLKVLAWDDLDTGLHLEDVANRLLEHLSWPDSHDARDGTWREHWSAAFELRPGEVVTTSKALAGRLAELARAIRIRIREVLEIESPDGPLTTLMKVFREALVHDLEPDDFADMYAQTIAYGLLSARVADPTGGSSAEHLPVTNPFLKELMETFLQTGTSDAFDDSLIDFDELGVTEVVQLLDAANMEAVVRDFGDRNPQEDPVIHFYQLFLQEYDAQKRVQRGVFYTPRPVVTFIVRSIDQLLRTTFGLADGLADTASWRELVAHNPSLTIPDGVDPEEPFVQILDPATGTGTFLVEAIDLIYRTMTAKWLALGHGPAALPDLWNDYVPNHLLPRLHGYELLMAPYAIAHLKLGLKLHETGYHFAGYERARIYLTNALEPPHDFEGRLEFAIPALAHEAQAVNDVKRHKHFTVIIGNPPYSRASSNKGAYAENLLVPYKDAVRDERNIQPLSDDYIKFVRLSQLLLDKAGAGAHGMITNNTFLSGRIHRGMRASLAASFPQAQILNLHGSGKVAFLGAAAAADENVFDILQGVAVAILARARQPAEMKYTDLVGRRQEKYDTLVASAGLTYEELHPAPPYYLWVPRTGQGADEFEHYTSLADIFDFVSVSGKPGDDNLLVSLQSDEVLPKLDLFREALRGPEPPKLTEAGRNLAALPPGEMFDPDLVIPYSYRPFDTRYTYYDPKIWTRAVKPLKRCIDGTPVLLTTKLVKDAAFSHVFVSREFADVIFLSNTSSVNCYSFPTGAGHDEDALDVGRALPFSNITVGCVADQVGRAVKGSEWFAYIYAILHSPHYRDRYYEQLQYDFPRIPVPSTAALLEELGGLGSQLIQLHLVEAPVQKAVTARYDHAARGWRCEVRDGELVPLLLTFVGGESPVVSRVAWSGGCVWIDATKPTPRSPDRAVTGTTGFDGVPDEVWRYRVGSYQVCEKWLKDRKGRPLTADDIAHYNRIVVGLSETLRLMRDVDSVIERHGGWPGAFGDA
jgi:hypothetical protein